MYHQIFHGRPVTSACIPRATDTPHRALEGTRLRACLLEASGCVRADPRGIAAEIRERDIGWIIVHEPNLPAGHRRILDGLLVGAGGERVPDPAGLTGYRFEVQPSSSASTLPSRR
jgi:hypothetical protein